MSKRSHAKQTPSEVERNLPPTLPPPTGPTLQELARRDSIARAEKEQAHTELYLKGRGWRIQTEIRIIDNQIIPGWRLVEI